MFSSLQINLTFFPLLPRGCAFLVWGAPPTRTETTDQQPPLNTTQHHPTPSVQKILAQKKKQSYQKETRTKTPQPKHLGLHAFAG